MRYNQTINFEQAISFQEKVLRTEEFLKEFWGYSSFLVSTSDAQKIDNTQLKDWANETKLLETIGFYAFIDPKNFEELKNNEYQYTPHRTEVFSFLFSTKAIEINFYNNDEGRQRERQFDKIVNNFKETISKEVPNIRIFRSKYGSLDIMCHHRNKEGKIGFSFTSEKNENEEGSCLFVYWDDFEIIRSSIVEGFNITVKGSELFDNTSWNDIDKNGCLYIVESLKTKKIDNLKEKTFVEYIVDWFEQEIISDRTVCVFGNL